MDRLLGVRREARLGGEKSRLVTVQTFEGDDDWKFLGLQLLTDTHMFLRSSLPGNEISNLQLQYRASGQLCPQDVLSNELNCTR